jgi:hypothetical protein
VLYVTTAIPYRSISPVLENAANVLAHKRRYHLGTTSAAGIRWNRYKERDHEHNVIVGNALTAKNAYENTILQRRRGIDCGAGDIRLWSWSKTDNVVLVTHKAHMPTRVKEVLARYCQR